VSGEGPVEPRSGEGAGHEASANGSTATARVPTASASRYLQQLCKHWAHNLAVEYTAERGTIRFPAEGRAGTFPGDALATLVARDDGLDVRIDASVPEQRGALKDVLARHLDRFAFREAPLSFPWRDEADQG